MEKAPFTVGEDELKPTLDGVDSLLEKLLKYYDIDREAVTAGAIAAIKTGAIAEEVKNIDNQVDDIIKSINSAIAAAIASAIAYTIADKETTILTLAQTPQERAMLLNKIGVTNHRKNYENYMLPLVNKGWLSMTIPDKLTSPKQKYLTT